MYLRTLVGVNAGQVDVGSRGKLARAMVVADVCARCASVQRRVRVTQVLHGDVQPIMAQACKPVRACVKLDPGTGHT